MKLHLHPGVGLPVVGSEPAPAVPLAVPEVEVRVAPRRLGRLPLERVVVVALVIIRKDVDQVKKFKRGKD